MSHTKGKPVVPEIKQAIVLLKQYFDRNKTQFVIQDSSAQMTADALEISRGTVDRVMAAYRNDPDTINTPPQPRGRPSYSIDTAHETAVRTFIRSANLEGGYITLETIRDFLREKAPDSSFHLTTLARTLDRWGFEFGKGKRTQHLKEKDSVVIARQRYLRKMRSNRSPNDHSRGIRSEVYLDESYVNKNHSNDFIWYSGEDGPWVQKPTGKGERLIIMNAITREGWVPNAKVVFKSTRRTGDYHGQMNGDLFQKWFREALLPNIPPASLIVMDNASYHNLLTEDSPPIPTSSKARIQEWLSDAGVPCKDDCLKVELLEILKKQASSPRYIIDEIASELGHAVIRTPPYHPELQPIEVCWGVVKNAIARNCNFTMANLYEQLEVAFDKVTAETCKKIIKKVRITEDKFWSEDAKMDENSEKKF